MRSDSTLHDTSISIRARNMSPMEFMSPVDYVKERQSFLGDRRRFSFIKVFILLFSSILAILLVFYLLPCADFSYSVTEDEGTTQRSRSFFEKENIPAADLLPDELIIVPGHAIYLVDALQEGHDVVTLNEKEKVFLQDGWLLQNSFQLEQTPFYMRHIQRGLELLEKNSNSVLIFSGGFFQNVL